METISGVGGANGVRNWGFYHFLKVSLLVFLDIAQDCSFRQCLTSSRAEISKKICGPNWGQNGLFYSNVVERPLKLRCLNFNLTLFKIYCDLE